MRLRQGLFLVTEGLTYLFLVRQTSRLVRAWAPQAFGSQHFPL